MGTNSGKILLFNGKNKLFKVFKSHVGRVNAISIDKSGDTIASAGEDGFVYVQILSENNRIQHKYTTAIRVLLPSSRDAVGAPSGPVFEGQGVRVWRAEGPSDPE